jgi:hypothetical protein
MTKRNTHHNHIRPRSISRREFIKLAAVAGLVAGCQAVKQPADTPVPTATPLPEPSATPAPTVAFNRSDVIKMYPDAPSKVVHTHHAGVWTGTPTELADSAEENTLLAPEALREMLDASITALTGLDKARDAWALLFSPEERIAIKVNAFRNSLIWTHAPLVTAVTDSLQDAGIPAEQIVIFDCYTRELEAAGFAINEDGPGVRCYGTEDNYTQEVTIEGVKNIRLSDILLECDALINMPVLKSHMLTGLSFAMKNHYGSINPPALLHYGIVNAMVELNTLAPIKERARLIVGDALTACLRYKNAYPYWTSDRTGDSILLSFDPVAIDTTALQMLSQFLIDEGGNPELIRATATRCLEGGAEAGLGTNDPTNMDLVELNLG